VHAVVTRRALLAILTSLLAMSLHPGSARADALVKATKESFEFANLKRTYTLFVPPSAVSGAPLLVLLHGSFGNGSGIVNAWTAVAEQEGIVLAGPDARDNEAWQPRADGPDFIRALIDNVAAKHAVDRSRIYLFGNSGGAVYSLMLSMLESELFAATAVHAGAWRAPNEFRAVPYARRKIPIAIFIGDRDEYFPLFAVRKTQKALEKAGHRVSVTVIPGHTHSYAQVAAEVNRSAWEFMKDNRL
jgi:poly(3-hydroxybutyrate) depolymerase